MKIIALLSFFVLTLSCASGTLLHQYKTPQRDDYQASKVLVIGISADQDMRTLFENKVVDALKSKGVLAVNSIDFFPNSFTQSDQSISELNSIETQLLGAGFDTILVAKITGKESRMNIVDSYANFKKDFQTFEDYYIKNQDLYKKQEKSVYTVYNTETSLFCICPGEDRELIWQGAIEVNDGVKPIKTMKRYLSTLLQSLENQNFLL